MNELEASLPSSERASRSAPPPIKPEANSPEFSVSRPSPVQRRPPPFFLPASLQGLEPRVAGRVRVPDAPSPLGESSAGRSRDRPVRGPRARRRHKHPARPRRPEGRAPSPRRRRHKHPAPASPPPPSRSVNPSSPDARLRGGGRARGWSCRVSSRERPGRRPACLQAPGLVAAAQARAARPPSARASRLPGAAEGGQVPGPPRRRRRRQPGRGREEGHRGGGRPGQAGEGAEEGRSRAASGTPALGALAAQIIRALEREAESGSRRTRKSRRFIAFAPHLPGAPHPPLPSHQFPSCSRPSTRSCGPGRLRDHSSLAPARAPALSAAAASSASPRRRAHVGTVLPLPHASARPAPPRPVGSAPTTAAARWSSWRDPDVVGPELQRGPASGGGADADDVTVLPGFSRRNRLPAPASGSS